MANIQRIERAKGTTFKIRVGAGYKANGTQIRKCMTWVAPKGLTEKQIQKELEKVVLEFEREIGIGLGNGKIKFEEFSKDWIIYAEKALAPKNVAEAKRKIEVINQSIGHIYLKDLNKQHIRTFVKELQQPKSRINKKTKEETQYTLSPTTIKNYYGQLRLMLTKAVQWDLIETNICLGKGIELPKLKRHDPHCLQDSDAIHFIELLEDENIQYKVFFNMALYLGLRNGELLGLRWSDIDFEKKLIEVNRSSQYIPSKGIFIKETKNKTSERSLFLAPELLVMLKQHKAVQAKERLKFGAAWQANMENTKEKWCDNWQDCKKCNSPYCSKKCKNFIAPNRIFTQINGIPMHPETPRQWLKRFINRTDLPEFTVHSLRHTNISLLIMQGVPLPTVAKLAGHSSTATTTKIYSHSINTAEQIAVEKISSILKKDKHSTV